MKKIIHPTIATTEQELKQALDSEAIVIYVESPLYYSIIENVKKTNAGKIMNGGGAIAALLGFLVVSGPLAWVMLLGGAIASALGHSMDSLKNYSVEIEEVRSRIILYRQTGKNKYKASKYQISNI